MTVAQPPRTNPEAIKDAFDLYLKYNGQQFELIEHEMHQKGWDKFRVSILKNKGRGDNFREGWIQRFGWENALKIKIASQGLLAQTSAEALLFEVETIGKKIFMELEAKGVGSGNKDLIYQHDKYVARRIEILDKLADARDNYANFVTFFQHFLKAATKISPSLAAELCDAEDAIVDWAEREFVTEAEAGSQ